MADSEQSRSEAATPHKLDEARKRGSVPKSVDVNTFLMLAAAIGVMYFDGAKIASGEMKLAHAIFAHGFPAEFSAEKLATWLSSLLGEAISLLAPLFVTVIIVGILSNLIQTGPVFSAHPLKPDLQRINPLAGFKRIYSLRFLAEAFKSLIKFILLGMVMGNAILAAIPDLMRTSGMSPMSVSAVFWPQSLHLLGQMLLALAAIVLLDGLYSRWDFARQMRMSRREIKEEVKRREGDPRIKARVRELQREAVKRAKSLSRIKEADVLVTNPVRLAVAIQFDPSRVDAPVVVAKGAGFLAWRMRSLARIHGVPIVENRPLARALFYQVGLERTVPEEFFGVIARIMIWAHTVKRRSVLELRRGFT